VYEDIGWQLKLGRLVKQLTKINANDATDIDAEYEALCAEYALLGV
jgi:hypothetical protein